MGYAPFGLIGNGPHAAVVRYDLIFLFAYALAFTGAYALARELGAPPLAAAVAGVAFAYAPWRLEQDGHLHVISSGGLPLALFLLVRGYRRESVGLVLAGWLVACWQLSLGFTLGLQLGYLLLLLGAPAVCWRLRAAPARACRDRRRRGLSSHSWESCSRSPTSPFATPTPRPPARSRTWRSTPGRSTCSSRRRTRAWSGARSPSRRASGSRSSRSRRSSRAS